MMDQTGDVQPEKSPESYDRYMESLFAREDEALKAAREEMQREGLPSINVSASEGKVLQMIVLLHGAKRILEIGTLGGYSAIWMARALPPDGQLVSLEIDPHHADVARRNLERAGLSDRVDVRVGAGLDLLDQMAENREAPFDIAFIDADKPTYVEYLAKAAPMVRDGGLILADNTLPEAVLDADADSGTKRYNAEVAGREDLVSVILPMLRDRGIDGLTVSLKKPSRV